MTDNEIIKAKELIKKLEEAYNAYYDTSKGMPYDIDKTLRESAICIENSLDEINRQKAEIERLKSKVNRLEKYDEERDIRLHARLTETARAEAVKEFAERLKGNFLKMEYIARTQRKKISVDELRAQADWLLHDITTQTIDNLVKEFTEGTKQ